MSSLELPLLLHLVQSSSTSTNMVYTSSDIPIFTTTATATTTKTAAKAVASLVKSSSPSSSSSSSSNKKQCMPSSSTTNGTKINDYYEESVMVRSSAHVSHIVGKQGSKIRQIRRQTETYIQTPVNGEEPMFVIKGPRESVHHARMLLLIEAYKYDQLLLIEACNYQDNNGKKQMNLFLPSRYIGLVVGKKGATIKHVMNLTGANIITPKVNTLNGFKLYGTETQIRTAVNLIKRHIVANGQVVYEECNNPHEINLRIESK